MFRIRLSYCSLAIVFSVWLQRRLLGRKQLRPGKTKDEFTCLYIYIYTSAHPCIQCTENVRLCVECNRHPWSCPAKRLRDSVSLTCLVRFVFVRLCPVERPSEAERARAANSSAPARLSGLGVQHASMASPCEASPGRRGLSGSVRFRSALPGRGRSEAERVRAANSNAPARPSPTEQSGAEQKLMPITDEQNTALFERMLRLRGRLERHFSSILWLRSKLERHFSSILRLRGRLEQHFSSILRLRARLEQHFSSLLRFRGRLERPFRASFGSGAGSSSHFEPSVAPEQARAALFEHSAAPGQARAALLEHPAAPGQA